VAGLWCVLLLGCAAPPPTTSPSPVPPGTTTPTASPTPSSPAPSGPGEPRVLAGRLDVPWDLAPLEDGSVLLTLRDRAQVLLLEPGREPSVVATIDEVVAAAEGGLLGIALSPGFADDRLVYLYYTAADDNRIVRYRYDDGGLSDPEVVLDGIPKANNHNGGRLRFGPDGRLYIGTGDAGQEGTSQDTGSLGGKILRVTADGGVPADNPFGNEVWSYGHRNVQGLAWDADGRMFASEFGQSSWDELNLITPGANYGWPEAEGESDDPDFTNPLLTWPTADASPSGIAVTPDGTVLVAGLRGERLWLSRWDGKGMTEPEVYFDGEGRLRAVELVGDELWVLTNNTWRGDPRPDDDRLLAIQAP
ncbi:MAG: PQQ-dependent sugar dehydrogenase, partial [Propionicimonas sp.]